MPEFPRTARRKTGEPGERSEAVGVSARGPRIDRQYRRGLRRSGSRPPNPTKITETTMLTRRCPASAAENSAAAIGRGEANGRVLQCVVHANAKQGEYQYQRRLASVDEQDQPKPTAKGTRQGPGFLRLS
jgi:hypothetical protein